MKIHRMQSFTWTHPSAMTPQSISVSLLKKLKLTLRKLSAEPFPTTKCYKLTVGDHPVIYYKTTVDVEDVRAYVIACYIYSGDMLTMFTAQLYDAESF